MLEREREQAARRSAAGAATLANRAASEPTGGMTLTQAIERQLGLEVQMRRRPVSTAVVESFDEKPSDN